ncbi:MAG: alanine racemase [Kurthia sp.]|nr:alanine racemase [Candidatus Kurthia equi]
MKQYNNAFREIERPFAWVDLEQLDANITTLSLLAKDKKVRIATKSIRSFGMLEYLQENMPYFNGWMTFTAQETVYLAERGLDNFLIGYPVMEKKVVTEACEWVHKGKSITFMVDDLQQAGWLNAIAESQDIVASVCIDINLSLPTPFVYFGTRRSSITNMEQFLQFIEQLQAMRNIKITGLMGYEAQLAGVGNAPNNMLKGVVIRQLQKYSKSKIADFRRRTVFKLKQEIDTIEFVNGGGTGSLDFTATSREVTEVTIGSGFYKPGLFDFYQKSELQPAAGFALRATRKPTVDTIVCHGGGYLASGPIDKERQPTIVSPGLTFYPTEGAGEVQTPLKMQANSYDIGDTIYFRHAKAGELCERFNELHLVRKGKYKGSYKTYRGDSQCFL